MLSFIVTVLLLQLVSADKFVVLRRVCVEFELGKSLRGALWRRGLQPHSLNVLIGSMTVEDLGRLTPLSDRKCALYPIDFW